VGRYLYDSPSPWAPITQRGKNYIFSDNVQDNLRKGFEKWQNSWSDSLPPAPSNGAQRPQNQATEATEQPTEEDCSKFITWARKQDRDGGPCTDDQYKYLDGITSQTTHKDVLKLLLGRDVSSENVPSAAVTKKLLDWLPAEIGSERQNTKRTNENYKPQYAACIRKLHETVIENSGQKKLIEEPTT
jgi:hypothetical protein